MAGFAGAMTGVAWAPKNLSVHVIESVCEVKNAGSGSFLGGVTLTGFTVEKGQIAGLASVEGTCTIGSGGRTVAVSGVLVPLAIEELSCERLDLALGDVTIPAANMTLKTGGMELVLAPGSRADGARFCAAARLAGTRSIAETISPLNALLFQ